MLGPGFNSPRLHSKMKKGEAMGSEPSASPSCVYALQCGLVLMLRTRALEGTDVHP